MLKEKIKDLIHTKVEEIIWKINWEVLKSIKSNPELYSDKENLEVKVPVSMVINIEKSEQEIWNWNDWIGEEWEQQIFDDYEIDFEISNLWNEIREDLIRYYDNNGYEIKIIKDESEIPYYVDAIVWHDPTTYEAEWKSLKEERLKRVNYFVLFKNWKKIDNNSIFSQLDKMIDDWINVQLLSFTEAIDSIILEEVNEKHNSNNLDLTFRASKVFPIPEISGIDEEVYEEFKTEEEFSKTILWDTHKLWVKNYYKNQGLSFELYYDFETIEYEDRVYWPYNYIHIKKTVITTPDVSNTPLLDTVDSDENHDNKSFVNIFGVFLILFVIIVLLSQLI